MSGATEKPAEIFGYDVIGDVHGCFVELLELLELIGYEIKEVPPSNFNFGYELIPPVGRRLAFVGDLADRGPEIPEVFKLVMSAVNAKNAFCVAGNHDDKLLRKLSGRAVQVKNGLAESLEQIRQEPTGLKEKIRQFLQTLPYYLCFDNGNLIVAHGGLPEMYHGKQDKSVRAICLYGPTSGDLDEQGLPVRLNWAKDYAGKPFIVYGHTPVAEPSWENNTVNIDTGCVFGGTLTALRYPEMVTVSVPAKNQYAVPRKPFR